MKTSKLEKRLQRSKDKLSIFAKKRLFNKYNIYDEELVRLIEIYLTDEEKAKLFEFDHFRNLYPDRIRNIVKLIETDELKLKLLKDNQLLLGMIDIYIVDIIKSLKDNGKMEILKDANYRKKYNIDEYYITNIIMTFTDEGKKRLLLDKDFLEHELKIGKYSISTIIASLESQNEKLNFIDKYKLKNSEIAQIVSSMDVNSIINFLNENKQFCQEKGIKPYIIMIGIDSKKQLEFISKLENIEELSIRRKEKNICNITKRSKRQNRYNRLSKRMQRYI